MVGEAALPIVVTRDALAAEDPYEIVQSNIGIVNRLRDAWLDEDEISHESWLAYLVDYFTTQLHDGGFSQFVFDSTWRETEVTLVREGLAAIGARETHARFERGAALVGSLTAEELEGFLESATLADDAKREQLEELDRELGAVDEDLVALNAAWIRGRPDLVVLDANDVEAWVDEQAATIPDLEARVAAAMENEPRYAKVIRRLLDAVGLELGQITAGDPAHEHEGRSIVAWHFLTADEEHYYMLDFGDQAATFDAETDEEVARVDVSDLSAVDLSP